MKTELKTLLLRISVSPFIFLYGVFVLMAGTIFPLPLLVLMSFFGLLLELFAELLKLSGTKISRIDPFFEYTKNRIINHFIGLTIYFWGAFAIVYVYIKYGDLVT